RDPLSSARVTSRSLLSLRSSDFTVPGLASGWAGCGSGSGCAAGGRWSDETVRARRAWIANTRASTATKRAATPKAPANDEDTHESLKHRLSVQVIAQRAPDGTD